MKVLGRHHLKAVLLAEIEVFARIDLTAKSYLHGTFWEKEAFFDGAADWCAVRVRAAEVSAPGVVVRVELDERDGAETFVDGAEDGEKDGMVSADAGGSSAGGEDVV
jgi:hypothetical protein